MRQLYILLCMLLLAAANPGCRLCDDPTDPECPNYCVDETDPACPNYDPCWNQTEVSAEFGIAEVIRGRDKTIYFPSDTVCKGPVRFQAKTQGAEYQWQIGSDPRVFTDREVSLFFLQPEEVMITLIVRKDPNLACFPGDDGLDTVRKRLVVLPIEKSALVGKYEGAVTSNPHERYVVEFFKRYKRDLADSMVFDRISVTNIHPGCDNSGAVKSFDVMTGSHAYKAFYFYKEGYELETGCFASNFFASLNERGDSIDIWYLRHDDFPPYAFNPDTFFFKGVRIE